MKKKFEILGLGAVALIIFTASLFNSGCTDRADLPAFLRIDTIVLDSTSYDSVGSTSSKITHAWVYIDNNLQGVYMLPCLVPVLELGKREIKVFAGVQENGQTAQATQYIFYNNWIDSVALVAGDTTHIEPHVTYERILLPFMEDFESVSQLQIDRESGQGSFTYSFIPGAKEGNGFGYMVLGQGQTELVCTTKVITTPKDKVGYFIEMDYRNNCDFLVGVRTSADGETVLGLYPKTEYNKIYINVTNQVDAISGTDLQLFFIVPQDSTILNQEVRIDNLKFLY